MYLSRIGHQRAKCLLMRFSPSISCLPSLAVTQTFWFSTSPPSSENPEVTITKAKRTRRRFSRMDNVPSLKDFLHRQTVLGLYRKFLTLVKPLADQREVQAQIRLEFKAMKNEADDWNKKRAVKEGERRLKDLQTTVSTSVTFGSSPFTTGTHGTNSGAEASEVGSGWPWERK